MLVALSAWLVTVHQMHGMHHNGAGLVAYLAAWVPMSAAMMLPSTLPTTALVARLGAGRVRTSAFVGGYLLVWMAVFAAAILVEKIVLGARATVPLAGALVVLAVWTIL